MKILRLSSVFEPAPASLRGRGAGFDPIGGMQNHTGALTRTLDRLGVGQTVVTSRLDGGRSEMSFGDRASVLRVGHPIKRFRQLWALEAARRLRDGGLGPFDVVHAHQGEDVALLPLAAAAARWFEAPLVVTLHCSVRHTLAPVTPRHRLLSAVGGPVERRGLRAADRIITLTRRAADLLAEDGVDAERISVIPSGFEPALFGGGGGTSTPPAHRRRPCVGYVGRFAAQKDVVGVVRAFDLLRDTDASLLLVGDGPERPAVEAAVASSPRTDHIERRGFVPHDQIPSVLAELDVMVLAPRYEELGSVLVEGLRAGVPIVASAVGGIPEVIRHGETGLLVPPGDAAALAAAVDLVLGDPDLAARLTAGARVASRAYDWDELARRVLDVYESASSVPTWFPVRTAWT